MTSITDAEASRIGARLILQISQEASEAIVDYDEVDPSEFHADFARMKLDDGNFDPRVVNAVKDWFGLA